MRTNREQTFPCMAHLTCVGHTSDDIARLLDEYADAGIENILALGGDPPADGSDPGGEYGTRSNWSERCARILPVSASAWRRIQSCTLGRRTARPIVGGSPTSSKRRTSP